jgi:hypothetical protein
LTIPEPTASHLVACSRLRAVRRQPVGQHDFEKLPDKHAGNFVIPAGKSATSDIAFTYTRVTRSKPMSPQNTRNTSRVPAKPNLLTTHVACHHQLQPRQRRPSDILTSNRPMKQFNRRQFSKAPLSPPPISNVRASGRPRPNVCRSNGIFAAVVGFGGRGGSS